MFDVGGAIRGAVRGGFGSGTVSEYKGNGSFINDQAGRDATLKQANERVLTSQTNAIADTITTDAAEEEMNVVHQNRQRLQNTSRQNSGQQVVNQKLAQNAAQQLA